MGVPLPSVCETCPAILPPVCGQASIVNPPSNAPSAAAAPYLDTSNLTKGCICTGGYYGDVCQFQPPAVVVAAAWRLSSLDMWLTFVVSTFVVHMTIEYGL